MRVLAIGAHPDDVELGAGATLAKHARAGDDVYIVTLGGGRDKEQAECAEGAGAAIGAKSVYVGSFPDQRFDDLPLIEIIQRIESHLKVAQPEVIYTHFSGDRNADHRLVHEAVVTACRPVWEHKARRILGFEITAWEQRVFDPRLFVNVDGYIEVKIRAIRAYASEARLFPHPRSEEVVRALAALRGSQAGVRAAEGFEVLREVA